MKRLKIDLLRLLGCRKAIAITVILIELVLIGILIDMARAEDAEPTPMYVLVSDGSWLNVRESPKPHAAITIRLTRGDQVDVYGISTDGWADIGRAGDPGYCRIEYLSDQLPTESESYTTTVGKVNVRMAPSGKMVRKLSKGAVVSVIGWVTDADGVEWANVGDGFVAKKYLQEAGSDD